MDLRCPFSRMSCYEFECGWWDAENERCAMATLAQYLSRVTGNPRNLPGCMKGDDPPCNTDP